MLLLDQVDAIRWTDKHQAAAGTMLAKLITETLTLLADRDPLVIAVCRSFDLKGEPTLAGLHREHENATFDVPLLAPETAAASLGLDTVQWDALPQRVRTLMVTPQALHLWHRVRPDGGDLSAVSSLAQLTQDLLDAASEQWERAGGDPGAAAGHIRRVAEALDRHRAVSVPRTAIAGLQRRDLDRLMSSGVLREAGVHRVAFSHQTVGEYVAADAELAALDAVGQTLPDFLIDRPPGILHRERLRQMLWLRRQRDPRAFRAEVEAILLHSEIRFHLRHTLLDFLGAVRDPTPAEAVTLFRVCDADAAADAFIRRRVFLGSDSWAAVALDTDLLGTWLRGAESGKREFAIWWLCNGGGDGLADRPADFALIELEKLVREWSTDDERLRDLLDRLQYFAWDVGSDTFFEARVADDARTSASRKYTNWKKAAKQHPGRALVLAAARVRRLEEALAGEADCHGVRDELDDWRHGIDDLISAINAVPKVAWGVLWPPLVWLIQALDAQPPDNDEDQPAAHPLSRSLGGQDLANLVERLASATASAASANLPKGVLEHLEDTAWPSSAWRLERAAAVGVVALPAEHAERGLAWISGSESRLWTGHRKEFEPPFVTQAEPILRFFDAHADAIDPEAVDRYIQVVLSLPPMQEFVRHSQWLEAQKEQALHPGLGRRQHALLSAVPRERVPEALRACLDAWDADLGPVVRGNAEPSFKGGMVRSAIPVEAEATLTDAQWLEHVRASVDPDPTQPRPDRWEPVSDGYTSTDAAELSGSMRNQAIREPARFVALSRSFPPDTPTDYFEAVVTAAAQEDREGGIRRNPAIPEDAAWSPAPVAEADNLICRIGFPGDTGLANAMGRAFHHRKDARWSEAALAFLARLATEHPNPGHDPGYGNDDESPARQLTGRAINDTRRRRRPRRRYRRPPPGSHRSRTSPARPGHRPARRRPRRLRARLRLPRRARPAGERPRSVRRPLLPPHRRRARRLLGHGRPLRSSSGTPMPATPTASSNSCSASSTPAARKPQLLRPGGPPGSGSTTAGSAERPTSCSTPRRGGPPSLARPSRSRWPRHPGKPPTPRATARR